MINGDLRGAVHARDAGLLATLTIEPGSQHYLMHRGVEWLVPVCVWHSGGKERESLRCVDEKAWSLSVAGLEVANQDTFDIQSAQHRWSIVPGWDALPDWWEWADGALEREEITQEVYDAPVNALVAKWRWCLGEIGDDDLAAGRAAARAAGTAAWDAGTAAWDAARAAAWDAARAAAWDAARAAGTAASADDWAAARDAAYQVYCNQFTAYVLWLIGQGRSA